MGTESVLIRHDFERGTKVTRSFGAGAGLSEAVFVPRADDADEADGWLMALVYSPESDSSALHILNAQDIDGDPQAVIQLPATGAGRVPRELGPGPGLIQVRLGRTPAGSLSGVFCGTGSSSTGC